MSVDNIYPYSSNKLLIRYSFRYTEIEYVYPHSYYKLWVRHSFSYTEIESQCNKYPWSFENISWIENIYFITPANLRQNGSLVIWGSQILKDPSLYHSLTPKLKNREIKAQDFILHNTSVTFTRVPQNIFHRVNNDQEVEKQLKPPLSNLKTYGVKTEWT